MFTFLNLNSNLFLASVNLQPFDHCESEIYNFSILPLLSHLLYSASAGRYQYYLLLNVSGMH